MAQGKRVGLSAAQKSDMWCRWKAGQSLHEMAAWRQESFVQFAVCVASRGFVPGVWRAAPRAQAE